MPGCCKWARDLWALRKRGHKGDVPWVFVEKEKSGAVRLLTCSSGDEPRRWVSCPMTICLSAPPLSFTLNNVCVFPGIFSKDSKTATRKLLFRRKADAAGRKIVCACCSNQIIAVADLEGNIELWETISGKALRSLAVPGTGGKSKRGHNRSGSLNNLWQKVMMRKKKKSTNVPSRTLEESAQKNSHASTITAMCLRRGWMYVGMGVGKIHIYTTSFVQPSHSTTVASLRFLKTLDHSKKAGKIQCVTATAAGDILFTATEQNHVTKWNVRTGSRVGRYIGHESIVRALCVVERLGKKLSLLSGGRDRLVKRLATSIACYLNRSNVQIVCLWPFSL